MQNELCCNKILECINDASRLEKMTYSDKEILAAEIRKFLIETVSKTGGHLAPNLGVVELTMAIHSIFDTKKDRVIWDVGHQCYVHKILTGRKEKMNTIRQLNGISGFPKCCESLEDAFDTGHSSTSISAAMGYAKARDILGQDYSVIAVIGDGALTGGLALEGLNDAGQSHTNIIVILNDNEMSIAKNVGGMSTYLSKIRTQPIYYKVKEDLDLLLNKIPGLGKSAQKAIGVVKGSIKYMLLPGMVFEELGFKYLGPVDGHNQAELEDVLTRAKNADGPVLVHVYTQKGKGYHHAECKPSLFHGISPFEIETGEVISSSGGTFSDVFGSEMISLAKYNKRLVAITAAMPLGTGLEQFSKEFPERFFDVAIAEQHAVTFAAGLARGGMVPVVALYSTFLQRAYDQLIHDVATQNLHVVIAVDRAGLVGEDGETHQGLYDLSFLSHIPNFTILAPSDYYEFRQMLDYAVNKHNGPIVVRYPRGKANENISESVPLEYAKGVTLRTGSDICIVAIGNMVQNALDVSDILAENGISAGVFSARFAKPLDREGIFEHAGKVKKLVTIEDNTILGGFGSTLLELLNEHNMYIPVKCFAFPDKFIEHGKKDELFKRYKLDSRSIADSIINWKI